jgi:hypothetical protein
MMGMRSRSVKLPSMINN